MSKCTTRSGLVLLVCMMVIALTSVLTLGVLECLRARTMLATRVSEETRAELLAEAGIQHGVAVLSDDETWRGASSWTAHPPGASDLYQYKIESVSDGKVGITGYGQANHATLQRYIELDLSKPFYLRDYRLPVADLVQVPPTQLMLPDYDDDGKLGTTLKESDKGLLETDPAKYLDWKSAVGDFTLTGSPQLTLFSVTKDYKDDKLVKVDAYLLDVRDDGGDMQVIASHSVSRPAWSPAGDWVKDTFEFGNVNHTLGPDRRLCVRVMVDKDGSDEDVWVGYDCDSHVSRLTIGASNYQEDQSSGVRYLRGFRLPVADLVQATPTNAVTPDYDDDGKPGTKVKKSDKGYLEDDSDKYLEWATLAGEPFTLTGTWRVELFSAVKDFQDEKEATLHMYLLDVRDDGGDVQLIASTTIGREEWNAEDEWVKDNFDFAGLNYTLAAGRRLHVRVVVDNDGSDDDMFIAYDSASHNSNLQMIAGG